MASSLKPLAQQVMVITGASSGIEAIHVVADVMAAFQVPRQQTGQPVQTREGALYRAGAEGRIYGCGNGKAGK